MIAIVALLVQAAILRRRHYRRGFDAGRQLAVVDTGKEQEMLAEWEEDGTFESEPTLTTDRQNAA